MKKKILIIIFALILILIGGSILFSNKKSEYVFGTVGRNTIIGTVSESGAVTSNGGTFIYSSTTGIISQVYVSNGDLIGEKQKLFSVQSTATPQQKAESYALYQAARSAVQQAENNRRSAAATLDRLYDDLSKGNKDETLSEKETRTIAEVANDNAHDALLAAKANLVSAQNNYNSLLNSTAVAPIPGIVSNLSIAVGNTVSVNSPLAPSAPVLFIKSNSPTEILITVGENDINKIKVGQNSNIKLDAIENKVYKGVVQRFDERGTVVQGVPKYNLYILVLDPDENIKSGMTADVDIVTSELTNVLVVPNAAVKPYQKGRAVRILDKNGKIQYLPIKIGVRGKEYTQIIEGLNEGQEIIVSLADEQVKKTGLFKL